MKGWWSAGGSPAKVNALKARGLISHWPPRRRFTARRYIYVSHMCARSKEAYCVLIFFFNWFLKKAILVWSCTIIAIFKDFWNKLTLSSYGDTKWHCEETLKNTLIPFASLSLSFHHQYILLNISLPILNESFFITTALSFFFAPLSNIYSWFRELK